MAQRNRSLGKVVFTAAVCGAGALWLWSAGGGAVLTERPAAAAPAPADSGASAAETGRMRADLARMQASLARAERRIAELESAKAVTDQAPTAVPPDQDPAAAPAEPSHEEQQALTASAFESEPEDASWNEREIEQVIRTVLPSGSALQSVSCRSTLCRVETRHPDAAAQRAYVDALGMPRPGEPRPFQGALFDQGAPSGNGRELRSVTYLVRRGHELPRPG